MLARRKNDLLASVLMSRVNSIQRMDLLADSSGPLTPGEKLLPSLPTPSYTTTPDSEEIPIMTLIGDLENHLNALSKSVSTYEEDALRPTVQKIIDTNNQLRSRTKMFAYHHQLDRQIDVLQDDGKDLNNRLKDSLRKLIGFRAELKQLPMTGEASKSEPGPGLDVNHVLKYALKLAKFTKAPSSITGAYQQVHPNNFVWPAEDALRRGMLAASSLRPDEIINAEIGTPQTEQHSQTSQDFSAPQVEAVEVEAETQVEPGIAPKIPSPAFSAPQPRAPRHVEPEQPLDLDLFDEDDFSE